MDCGPFGIALADSILRDVFLELQDIRAHGDKPRLAIERRSESPWHLGWRTQRLLHRGAELHR